MTNPIVFSLLSSHQWALPKVSGFRQSEARFRQSKETWASCRGFWTLPAIVDNSASHLWRPKQFLHYAMLSVAECDTKWPLRFQDILPGQSNRSSQPCWRGKAFAGCDHGIDTVV